MQLIVEDFESMAPVTLHPRREPFTDEEFVSICEQYPDCLVEVSADGEISIMPPNCSRTGEINGWIAAQLVMWSRTDGRGTCIDSSGGCVLPNGARRAADAAWVRKERVAALPEQQRKKFYHLCPDFVIEFRLESDRSSRVEAKMEEYLANGAQLGWLIDLLEKRVMIYRPNCASESIQSPSKLTG